MKEGSTIEIPKAYRCERCGAPLEVTPESIIVVCEYCGNPNWTTETREEIYIVPSLNRSGIERSFRQRVAEDFDLRRIRNKISIVEINGIYVPFYFVTVKVEARYEGFKKKIERVETGRKARTIIKRERVSGKLKSTFRIPVLARRSAEDFSIFELAEHFRQSKPDLIKIEEVEWEKVRLPVLNTEISSLEAKDLARDEAGDRMREKAESKVDELTEFQCKTRVIDISPLILVPYWYLVYSYEKAQYKAAYAGWSSHLLAVQEPVMAYHRALYFAGVLASCAIAALGFAYLRDLRVALGALFFASSLSYALGRKTVSDVRVERE